jgi:flagellar protein FlaG
MEIGSVDITVHVDVNNVAKNEGPTLQPNKSEKEHSSKLEMTNTEKENDKNIDFLKKIIEDLKKKLSMLNTQLEIKVDKETEEIVVKVIDKETKEVIRQIPPEYLLKIAKYLDEIAGILYNEKV